MSQKPVRYLVVDDSRVIREVIKVFLMGPGVEIADCANGTDALALIKRQPPDLVIADMRMPGLDGPGLCQAMALDPALRHIPVLILTSMKDAVSREQCLKAGARELLTKPVTPEALRAAISRHR